MHVVWVIIFFIHQGMGHILIRPKDTETIIGTQLILPCQTTTNRVEWHIKKKMKHTWQFIIVDY